jgi:fatty-acyl-CoA synthase
MTPSLAGAGELARWDDSKDERGLHAIGRWVSMRARLSPDRTAVEYAGQAISYRELDEGSNDLARGLLARGLSRGDRIATLTENRPEHVALFFACAKAGLVLAPLNWHLTARELAEQLEIFSPALLVASTAHLDRFDDARRLVATSQPPMALESLRHELGRTSGRLPEVRGDDGLLLIATSGTTGTPKGALLSHANCFWTNLALDLSAPIGHRDVVLQFLPQCHVGGWNVQPLLAWWKGATVILEDAFDPRRVLELIAARRVTTMMGVPTNYLLLAQEPGFADADLSSLHTVIAGGAVMPVALIKRWHERDVAVVQGYGLTEASPNVCCLAPEDAITHAGSVGRPYAYVDVELRDAVGRPVEGAGRGEIHVRGPNVFAGYWQNPSATAEVLRDGWLATGDIAERDDEGYYRISGRTKEMYVSGGENVYPAEIEMVLTSHDGVLEAAVVATAHPRWGETGVAFVVARPGARLDVAELLAHCRCNLAPYKVPSEVRVVDELPRSHIGKLDKSRLVTDMSEGLDATPQTEGARGTRR